MKICFVMLLLLVAAGSYSQSKGKVVYKYKKYQKFDFEDLVVDGDSGKPGDISITSRFQKKFRNNLPYRRNFHPEMIRSIESVR